MGRGDPRPRSKTCRNHVTPSLWQRRTFATSEMAVKDMQRSWTSLDDHSMFLLNCIRMAGPTLTGYDRAPGHPRHLLLRSDPDRPASCASRHATPPWLPLANRTMECSWFTCTSPPDSFVAGGAGEHCEESEREGPSESFPTARTRYGTNFTRAMRMSESFLWRFVETQLHPLALRPLPVCRREQVLPYVTRLHVVPGGSDRESKSRSCQCEG